VKSSEGTNDYDDESEIDQISNFKRSYTNDCSEKKIKLYGLEIIPKVGILS
jgi:hypothetical protein